MIKFDTNFMRILILGNMANDGYSVAKELRKMNVDVDLAVNTSDFGMALPEWEDAEIESNVDPFLVNRNEIKSAWVPPAWIRYFDFHNKVPRKKHMMAKIKSRINLIRMMREYDIIETHVPFSLYSQFSGMPYVAYDAGWIRYFPYGNTIRDKLARRGYRKAKGIIMTNSDALRISDSLPYLKNKKISFVPFAIDPEKYKPLDAREIRARCAKEDEFLLFSPARQYWAEKGNDKLIRAFAKFVKVFPKSKLLLVSWSIDKDKSKELVSSLRISDKIVWIDPLPKNQLIRYFNAADIVLDQFVLGGWGTTTPEAISCGKPTITSWAGKDRQDEPYIIRAYEQKPPLLHAWHEEEIYHILVKCAGDIEFRHESANQCREWIMKTHGSRTVASKHLQVLNAAMQR